MTAYITRRVLGSLVTVLLIVTLAFVFVRLAPGDPGTLWLGDYATPDSIAAFNHSLGLDRSLPVQYLEYVKQLFHGDLGVSLSARRDVFDLLMSQFPYTLELTLASLIVSTAMGLPMGALAALRRGSWIDLFATLSTVTWLAIPSFWFGLLLLLVFSVELGWFPLIGAGDPGSPASILSHLVLPAIALGARQAAVIARMFRSTILDVSGEDYVRTARAKGVSERWVIWRHIMRNALGPVVNITAVDLIAVLGGAVVVESVFSRPGIGSLLVEAVSERDYTMVQGALLLFAVSVVAINLVADVLQAWFEPRVRLA